MAKRALQLGSVSGPNQLTVVTMKLTADMFADRKQLIEMYVLGYRQILGRLTD